MSLRIAPCRTLCDWGPTRARRADEPLFACTGCGAQWVPSEPWTPRQADGTVPASVRAALTSGSVTSGTVTSGTVTSGPGAGGAGTAGS